jgi:hypothetical protein
LPHRDGPHYLFVVGQDVAVTEEKLPTAIGVVPTISQNGQNRQFSAVTSPEISA